jgi:adenylosuccinate synthase
MGATVIVDAFWGDAGKGKFAAYLSRLYDADICVRAGVGPNAGHSVFVGERLIKTKLVPLGLLNQRTRLRIGSGVAIDPALVVEESRRYRCRSRTAVDFRCPVIEPRHVAMERESSVLREIDSTFSGSGAARAEYIMRSGIRAGSVAALKGMVTDVAKECNFAAARGRVIVEGSQATFLSVYLSDRYPYVTSDNCTTAALIDDVGLAWNAVDQVILLVKCIPTAVGAGPLPNEMLRDEIIARGLMEYGTNTGRERRRIRGIDFQMLRYSVMLNGPTEIALTYCEQYDPEITDCTNKRALTRKMRALITRVEKSVSVPVTYLETGKQHDSIIALR